MKMRILSFLVPALFARTSMIDAATGIDGTSAAVELPTGESAATLDQPTPVDAQTTTDTVTAVELTTTSDAVAAIALPDADLATTSKQAIATDLPTATDVVAAVELSATTHQDTAAAFESEAAGGESAASAAEPTPSHPANAWLDEIENEVDGWMTHITVAQRIKAFVRQARSHLF